MPDWKDLTPTSPAAPAKRGGGVDWSQFEPIQPNKDGQFASGFKRSIEEVPGLLAGVGAFAADAVGAEKARDAMLGYAKTQNDALAEKHQNDAQSLTDAWDGKSNWLDFLSNSAGYVAGQALQSLATGGVGALGAKMLATQGVKTVAEVAAARAIAGGATAEVATAAAAAAAKKAGEKALERGAVVGAGAHNFGMELGSIYPDAVDQANAEGRAGLDKADMLRVFGAASLAAGVDTAGEAIMASRVLRGSKVGAGAEKAPTLLKSEFLARAAREVPAGMAREGVTEAAQTAIEHYGAGTPIADEKGLRDIIDSAGVGMVGGMLGGAGASLRRREAAPAQPQQPQQPQPTIADIVAPGATLEQSVAAAAAVVSRRRPTPIDFAANAPRVPTGEATELDAADPVFAPGAPTEPAPAPEPIGDPWPGDRVSRLTGKPFTTMEPAMSALARAGEDTHELVRVNGGLVVRAKNAATVIPTGEATETPFIPTGEATELPAHEGMIAPIPTGEATEIDPETVDAAAPPEMQAGMVPRRNTGATQIDLSGKVSADAYVNKLRSVNTMAARALVQSYDAGILSAPDIMQALVPTRAAEPTPDQRLAAAAAQAPKIQPSDLLTIDGQTYGTRIGANKRLDAEQERNPKFSGAVVLVPGSGFVVRPGSANDNKPDVAATTRQPAGSGDGRASADVGSGGNLGLQPDGDGGNNAAAATPAPGGGEAVAARGGDQRDAALSDLQAGLDEVSAALPKKDVPARETPFPPADDAEIDAARAAWAESHSEANGQRLRRALGKVAPLPPVAAGMFDSEAFDRERNARIKASREAGNVHLDKVPAYVETMRGKQINYVHDPKVKGRILTVDNNGSVYVEWLDAYSQEKERAVPMKLGKKTVMQTSLGPRDLKDYALQGAPNAAAPAGPANTQPQGANAPGAAAPSDPAKAGAAAAKAGEPRKAPVAMGLKDKKGWLAGWDDASAPATAKPAPNTIFTEDAAAAARARLKAKLGRLQSGIDPETMMDGITLAGYHIEKGARTFAVYARAMVDDLGDAVKPYLQSWYMAVRADPRAEGMRADMDKASAVEDLDMDQVLAENAPAGEKATLHDTLRAAIAAGNMPKDNPALRKMVAEFDGEAPGQARMKVAQEDLEAAIVQTARQVVADNKAEGENTTFAILKRLYESQPNLNIRTSDSIERQAYSTPAPLAYLGARLAGITPTTTVYEPTAGSGMLTITAAPANVTATELDTQRAEILREQGINVTQGDALTAEVQAKSKDRVIANPPFGPIKNDKGESIKVKFDGYTMGQIDHLIAARALEAMKDDGKATLIIGANKATGQQSNNDLIFFNWLYGNYNVTSHFEVEGDLYQRQGAGWPVRVITINGRAKSSTTAPNATTIQRANTWSEVYDQFQHGMAAGWTSAVPGASVVGARPQRADDARTVPGAPAAEAGRADSSRPEGGARGNANVTGERAGPVGDRAAAPSEGVGERTGGVGSNDQAPGPIENARVTVAGAAPKLAGNPGAAGVTSADPDNQFQTKYIARSDRKDEGVLIPVNMAGPTQDALNRLEDEVGNIDQFAAKELGYASVAELHRALMGLQVDSVASAINQIKAGNGIIIADQTGIGKGRQAASIIRWAARNGKTPIFVTVKPSLFTDMYGDLHDIGTDDIAPMLMNSDASIKGEGDEKLFANTPALHRRTLESIAATGQLPAGRNALFMTYSQINVDNIQRRAVMALAPNAVFVLDESHNAGGASATGNFIKGALDLASGVTYLSATYAKRPDNMPVYFKTDIGQAVADDNTLTAAMAAGGLPLQTVVSNNLVKAGQMFRRERSYDGVSIESRADTEHRIEHVALSDETTLALRAIVSADRTFHHFYVKALQKQLEKEGSRVLDMAGNQAQESVDHTQFSSVVHNFVRQMLLGLKAQEAANDAIRSLKRGEKPLIAVENTMGSFLAEYAENNSIAAGSPLGAFDYRTVLSRALERSRYIVRQLPNGDKVKEYIPMSGLDPESYAAYTKAQAIIDKLKIDIPVSPIDWMRDQITKAGYSVAEVTGRNLSVDYSDSKNPKLSQIDSREQKDKVRTTRQFNDGSLDAIILNVAGSTGISLHASEKFKDQRQRHMIVAQAAQDINIFMQMLGRVHRTGQVVLPKYTLLSADLPAEIRPTALLSGKMKSLNANTSSNTESATSVKSADMLNKYGDAVVQQYLADNYELAQALDLDSGDVDAEGKGEEDIARKATGRLALMPVKVQEQFYAEVEEQYQALIDYLNKTNQNDLEPRTFDFDAQETRSAVLFEGQNKASPFGEDAIYGEFSVKAQGKAMTPVEIRATMDEHLAGQTPAAHVKALADPLRAAYLKMRDGLADDAQKEKADSLARAGAAFFDAHKIGAMFRVDINGESYNAIITNIRSTHKAAGNPFSLSKIQVTIAVNGALRSVTLPATQFGKIEVSRITGGFGSTIEAAFKVGPPNEREVAKIVTGNLLGAYGEIEGTRGSIITFSKADGTTEQGILLPKAFNFTKDVKQDYRLKTGADVFKFVTTSTNDNIDRFGINSRDQVVRVLPAGRDGITIQVPKSRAKGGKYFLDNALRTAAGDFVSSGNFMRATVAGKDKAVKALDVLMQKGALYALPSMAEEARAIVGDSEPTPGAMLSRTAGPEGITRRNLLLTAAAAGVPGVARAEAALGKARPLTDAMLNARLSPAIEKTLRAGQASGTTNIEGHKAILAAMREIAATGPVELRPLAARIAAMLPRDGVMLTVDDKGQWNAHGAVEFSPMTHMKLFTADGRRGMTYGTFLHESLHLMVLAKYRTLSQSLLRSNDAKVGLAAPAAAEKMAQFRALWDEFATVARDNSALDAETKLSVDEARGNPDEFFVRALTDSKFQTYLAGIEYEGKTLWARFKDWVTGLIFKSGTRPSWLDAALLASTELHEAADKDASDYARSRAMSGFDAKRGAAQQDRSFQRAAEQTDTPAFRAWFGESKVVDDEGRALVVYHGTQRAGPDGIQSFKAGATMMTGYAGKAPKQSVTWFASSPSVASGYAQQLKATEDGGPMGGEAVYPVYLSIKRPASLQDVYATKHGDTEPEISLYDQRVIRELEAKGFDGVAYTVAEYSGTPAQEGDSTTYVAFHPEQIKSAVGNIGTFDPANPNILYSRTIREALADGAATVRDLSLPLNYKVNDFIESHGKLSWWDKTVGTPYNLAKRYPTTFGRVYDAVQRFLSDTSYYATEAGKLAPTLLPTLDKLSDIRKAPLSPADNQAIKAPVFEGTLNWTRDAQGKPIRMEDAEAAAMNLTAEEKGQELLRAGRLDPKVLRMWQGLPVDQYESIIEGKYASELLRPGVVWTDAELRSMFKLTDKQIGLYHETRAALDKSLDDLSISEMLRLGGKDTEAMRESVLGMGAAAASQELRDHLFGMAGADPERADVLNKTADDIVKLGNRVTDLKAKGYAPLSRFGHYTLDVVNDGERVYFGMFESEYDANKMARRMRANYPKAQVQQGTQDTESYKQFAGISPETLALFGDLVGLSQDGTSEADQVYQTYLKKAVNTRSALRRMIHRQGIAGFNEDVGRVLAGFIMSNARRTSSNLHMGEVSSSVLDMPKQNGELKTYAAQMAEYIQNPQEEAQAFRGLLFTQYLGGSVASAMVNMTQPIAVTFPYLSQFGGTKKAAGNIAAAFKDLAGRTKLAPDLAAALKHAEETGIVSPQEVFQLMNQAQGKGALRAGDGTTAGNAWAKVNNAGAKVMLGWGKLFSFAEQVNRRVTFIAAYRTAQEQGMDNPAEFAANAVTETQFTYNKGNKPQWARGAVGGTLFTFKTYSVSYLELVARMWRQGGPVGKKAALLALATLAMMGGSDGLPFMEDVENLIDGFMQRVMGRNWSTRQKRNEALADALGEDTQQILSKGFSAIPGMPIDVSGRFGMAHLIPGTGLLRKNSTASDATEVFGPAGDFVKRGTQAAFQAAQGDIGKSALTISPTAIRNVAKAADMAKQGAYMDASGKKVIDTTPAEAFMKGVGFQPNSVAQVQDTSRRVQQMIALNKTTSSEIADAWAQALAQGDQDAVQEARDRLRQWNSDNPESPIRITYPQLAQRIKAIRSTRAERLERTAPAAIRSTVHGALVTQ